MCEPRPETLKDLFVALAEKRGIAPATLDVAMKSGGRADQWETAGAMTIAQFSVTLGLSQQKVRELVERDFDRMMPQVH